MIKPTAKRILVKLTPKTDEVKGGIFIPASAAGKTETREGEVLEIGSKVEGVAVGNRVLIQSWGGSSVRVDDSESLIVDEDAILAVLD